MNRDAGCSSNSHRLPPLRSRIHGGTATASSSSWSSGGRPVSRIQADDTTSSSQLHPKADVQIECHSRAGRRLVKKRECSCCKSATTDHQRPFRSRVHDGGTAAVASPLSPNEERPSTDNKARKASCSQLPPKTDIKKECKSRAGRQLVKKRQCRCCEPDTHHEHQLSASKSTSVNHSHRAEQRSTESRASSVNTARRKLILDDAQGAVALCAPRVSRASSKNAMTGQHRKPTPIVDNKEHASNAHLRVKSQLTQHKQNPNIKDTSGPQSAAACKNNVSANHHKSPSVFEKHVAASPPKVLAEKQICSGTNASTRKMSQSQFRDANSSSSTHQQPLHNQVCDDGAPAAASSASWPNRAQPTTKNKARKATSSSQLLLKADSQEEYNLRAGQQSVKKHKCGSCRSIPCHEHQPSPSKGSKANYLCGAASSHSETQASSVKTARRKLILDDAQGAATVCAPGTSDALCEDATEQHRKCTPAMGHEEHASNARLGTKPRMTRSKQNPNTKDTSGPQSDAVLKNTVSANHRTLSSVFGRHVVAAPARTPAGKRIHSASNAAPRRVALSRLCSASDDKTYLEQHDTKEAAPSKGCISRVKRSTKKQKPSDLNVLSTSKPAGHLSAYDLYHLCLESSVKLSVPVNLLE
ncbi:hypothetical protein HPB50_001449 [Hyalomma asiaticum]|uniref:Uncharacterized protein n=1 Tax=Hyalomma asiaticum TaxID=266040 RepID=A0ACB7S9U1_HYAAI|nr:hypothetical protein HPB50_001449 [Hyalomma asiaticum]